MSESDGYHTFDELYAHRRALTAALAQTLPPAWSYRSKAHDPSDDPISAGYFIVGINLSRHGWITYHYPLEYWDDFKDVRELPYSVKWDGHTSTDVVDRLMAWATTPQQSKKPVTKSMRLPRDFTIEQWDKVEELEARVRLLESHLE